MKKNHFTLSRDLDNDEGLINLTPLIDVVFVMLILFILIAPLMELDRVQLAPAAHGGKKEVLPMQENTPLKIHVFADNTIWINQNLIAHHELGPLMKQIKEHVPDATPQIFHDKEAKFGTYQMVKNALEIAGFEEMDVMLK